MSNKKHNWEFDEEIESAMVGDADFNRRAKEESYEEQREREKRTKRDDDNLIYDMFQGGNFGRNQFQVNEFLRALEYSYKSLDNIIIETESGVRRSFREWIAFYNGDHRLTELWAKHNCTVTCGAWVFHHKIPLPPPSSDFFVRHGVHKAHSHNSNIDDSSSDGSDDEASGKWGYCDGGMRVPYSSSHNRSAVHNTLNSLQTRLSTLMQQMQLKG
jgi:hypothetical protein